MICECSKFKEPYAAQKKGGGGGPSSVAEPSEGKKRRGEDQFQGGRKAWCFDNRLEGVHDPKEGVNWEERREEAPRERGANEDLFYIQKKKLKIDETNA